MKPDVSAVLFDLDDTLCRYRRPTAELLDVAFQRTGVEPFFSAADFAELVPEVTAADPLDLREKCFRAIAEENGRPAALAERLAANYPERDPTDVTLLPGAETALEALSDRYRLGVVSNGAAGTQRTKLETLGIAGYFDTEVFATPETAVKPDPAPFHRALADLGVDPREAVHVGNSPESDVAGARAAGVRAVWLRAGDAVPPTRAPEHVVDGLADLHEDPMPWE